MHRRWIALCLSLLCVLCVSAVQSPAADWPQWLGPNRDGSTPEIVKPWTGPLKVLWRTKVGDGHSSPVVAGDKVILHTADSDQVEDRPAVRAATEYVTAYDAATGEVGWVARMSKKPFKSEFGIGPRATPAVAGGKVFCFGVTGTFAVFDVGSGKLLADAVDLIEEHKAKVPYFGVSASPLVEDGRVHLQVGGPEGAGLVMIAADTLKPVGKILSDAASYAAPNAVGIGTSRQVVVLTAEAVYGLPPGGGAPFWRYRFKDLLSESSATPVQVGDLIVASSVTLGAVALRLTEKDGKPAGSEVWRNGRLSCYFSTPVPVGTDLYVVTGQMFPPTATLHCVDAATGKIRWSRPKVGKYGATLVRTGDDKLLMLEEGGDMVLIQPDAEQYKELARAKVCGETWAHFAVASGRLFVRDKTELICIDLPK